MTKVTRYAIVLVVMSFVAVAAVFAAGPAPQVPAGAEDAILDYCGIKSEGGKIDVDNDDPWGNSTRFTNQGLRVAGSAVGGSCTVPLEVLPPQIVLNEFCGLRGNGQPRVRTDRPNWANGARWLNNGNLRLAGDSVFGRCTIPAGPAANAIWSMIPKNQ